MRNRSKIIIALLAWFLALAASAQIPAGFVQVSATVPSLANGSFGAAWTNQSGAPQLPLLGCVSAFQTTINGQFDSNGSFSVLVAANNQICPSPSTWTWSFTFHCTGGSINGGFQVAIPINGGGTTQNISAAVTAALPSNPCSGGGGGGGGSPVSPPAFTVQAANAPATALTSDPAITINTSTHTLDVGGPISTNSVTIGPHAVPASSWTFDTYSPATACNSIGCLGASGGTLSGNLSAPCVNGVCYASNPAFVGADCASKINAAFAYFTGLSLLGEVDVDPSCTTAGALGTTAINIPAGMDLVFTQGGVYTTQATITLNANSALYSRLKDATGGPTVIEALPTGSTPLQFLVNVVGPSAVVEDVTLDGNSTFVGNILGACSNGGTAGVGGTGSAVLNLTGSAGRFESRRVEVRCSGGDGVTSAAPIVKMHTMEINGNAGYGYNCTNVADAFIGDGTELDGNGLAGINLNGCGSQRLYNVDVSTNGRLGTPLSTGCEIYVHGSGGHQANNNTFLQTQSGARNSMICEIGTGQTTQLNSYIGFQSLGTINAQPTIYLLDAASDVFEGTMDKGASTLGVSVTESSGGNNIPSTFRIAFDTLWTSESAAISDSVVNSDDFTGSVVGGQFPLQYKLGPYITCTTASSSPTCALNTTNVFDNYDIFQFFEPLQSTGGYHSAIRVGKSTVAFNSAVFGFINNSASSTTNLAFLGVGGGPLVTVDGNGNLFVPSLTSGGTSCVEALATGQLGLTGAPCGSGGGGSGTVTNFSTGAWPSWLTPGVTAPTTAPVLSVTASAIPNSALANAATTVNGVSCTLGSTCSIVTALPLAAVNQAFVASDTSGAGHSITPASSLYNMVVNGAIDNTCTTDVSAAVATIILAASSTNPTPFYFPPGCYKINSGINLACTATTCNGLVLTGAGADATIFQTTCAGNSYGIWYNNTTNSGDNFKGARFEHFQIQDTSGTGACQDLLRLTQTARNVINDVKVSGAIGLTYSTGTVGSSGATITGSGTTFTAAMAHGILMVTSGTTTTRAEICAFGSATSLTLCDSAFPGGTIAGGTSYAIAYGGRGITLDPGNSFTQYVSIHDSYAPGNMYGLFLMGSNSGSNGVSRVSVDGDADFIANTPGSRVTNSIGVWAGRHSDTLDFSSAINNVGACYVFDSSHAWEVRGKCEDNATYAPITTCNAGVGTQNCTVAAEISADANGTGWNGSFTNMYAYLVGTVYQYDNAAGAFNTFITGDRTLSGQFTTHYSFSGAAGCPSNNSGITAVISTWDCPYSQGNPNQQITITAQTINSGVCIGPSTLTFAGVDTKSIVTFTAVTDITAVSGWSPGTGGGSLLFTGVPTANTITWKLCNYGTTNVTTASSVVWNVGVK